MKCFFFLVVHFMFLVFCSKVNICKKLNICREEGKKGDEEKSPPTTIDGMLKEYFTDNMHEPPIKYCTVFQVLFV